MKNLKIEHLIIAVLVILLAITYFKPREYRYQTVNNIGVFDKKTGTYYTIEGKVNVVEKGSAVSEDR